MSSQSKARTCIRVEIIDNGESVGQPITVVGRNAWALKNLIKAGKNGCTPLTHPGPRWAHYVYRLRGAGFAIETEHEPHGGDFPGTHAKYRLCSDLRVLEGGAA